MAKKTDTADRSASDPGLAMSWEEWLRYDATGLAELVRSKQVTAKELARQAAHGIELMNPKLNAVVEVFTDRVEGLDEKTIPAGAFTGVPFVLKDLGAAEKGRVQEWGTRLLAGSPAQQDSVITERMRAAGLNILARTTCPELGFTLVTESAIYGITRNPWNLERSPGGSSGGSAALVAAGVLPMAHSNDGGGSTRIPASMCGNVGMKHSRGRVTHAPAGNDLVMPLVNEAVNSRTVRDSAAFLDAIQGPTPGEAFPYPTPERPFREELEQPAGRLRIAVAAGVWGNVTPTPEIAAEVRRVAKLLADSGHTVEERAPSFDFDIYRRAFQVQWITSSAGLVSVLAEATGRPVGPDTLEPITLKAVQAARTISAEDYAGTFVVMDRVGRQLGAFFEEWDVLLTPTLARPTPEIGSRLTLDHPEMDLEEWFDNALSYVPYTPLCNFTGIPAISLPLGRHPDGMPLGMHFVGPMGADARLLRLAAALERAHPWHERRPPLTVATA